MHDNQILAKRTFLFGSRPVLHVSRIANLGSLILIFRIAEWLKEKETKDEEREKKRQAKLERILNPKYTYEDKGYTSNLQLNAEKVDEALQQGMLCGLRPCSY